MQNKNDMQTISVQELHHRVAQGDAVVVDVREYPEYVEAHIQGTLWKPLGELRHNPYITDESGQPVTGEMFLLCRSGRRAETAAKLFQEAHQAATPDDSALKPVVVAGGIEAWRQAGYEVASLKGPISLERQVRIAAGSLVLAGVLIPGLGFLPYFIGAGLICAGVTNTCGMGLLLARLPWNQPRHQASSRNASGATCPPPA